MMAKIEKVTEKTETKATADARAAPVMKSHALTWQSQGSVWREAFVRLPEGMLLQDLQDVPTVWKNIQSTAQTSLQRFDRVTCVAFDESWAVKDVMVADADNQRVVLAIRAGDRITLSSKAAEWEDDRHRIRWAGAGFAVFRKTDGVQVLTGHFGTIESAKSEMFRQFYATRQVA